MTSKQKRQFNDCKAEVITLESQSIIVTSIAGERDDWQQEQQGTNGGLISDEKSL